MTDLPPRQRKARPAPAEPPVGALGATTAETPTTAQADYPVPHDLKWTQPKTLRMTDEHTQLLNELKFHHGLKIQEAVWYAIEQTFGNK